jgi:hypothetical protein
MSDLTPEEYEATRDAGDPSALEIIKQAGSWQAAMATAHEGLAQDLKETAEPVNSLTSRAMRSMHAALLGGGD